MRERRRLRLAERQMMLARVARREAMAALSETIEEEAKSASLGQRSRDLAHGYSTRADIISADELRGLRAMAGGLARLAKDADNSRDDARQQAEWQIAALANAENRLQRMEELAAEARQSLDRAQTMRSASPESGHGSEMARKLLSSSSKP